VTDPPVKIYLMALAEALQETSVARNQILYARPAKAGEVVLYRWAHHKDDVESFPVTAEWLDEHTDLLRKRHQAALALRPPLSYQYQPAQPPGVQA
jgi:hypothetical protein